MDFLFKEQMKKNKKNFKILTATGMCLFSLVAVFTATIAWFAAHKKVNASGMLVQAHKSGSSFSTITVHKALISECTNDRYVFSTKKELISAVNENGTTSVGGDTIAMDQYSDIGPSQPILLLFTLPDDTSVDNSIYLEGICTYTGNSAQYIASLSNLNTSNTQKLSSIVTFYGRTSTANSSYFTFDDVTTKKITFSRNSTYLTTSSFVTASNNTISNFTKNIELYDGAAVNKGDTGEAEYIKYVAIVMDYNEDAINYIYNVNNNPGEIHYAIDWKMNMR